MTSFAGSSWESADAQVSRAQGALRGHRLYDPVVVFVVGVLMALGVAMVYSASVTVVGPPLDWRNWWHSPLRQAAFAAAGFFVMLVAAHTDYRILAWRKRGGGWAAGLLLLLTIGLLVAVLIPGVGRHALGARRALFIPGVGLGFQPSELAKVVLVIWLAAALSRPSEPHRRRWRFPLLKPPKDHADQRRFPPGDIRDFRSGFLPAALGTGLLIGLTGIEDFGTAALMGVVMLVLLLTGGARWAHLGLTVLCGLAAGVVLILIEPYRIKRIVTFLSGGADAAGAGYQIKQAMLAIGSGGWFGRGLGAGVQKYGYLPQDNNDFIFAILCEELGVVGGIVVVALFLLLLWRGWRISARAEGGFGRLLALGLTLLICLQAAFNIGVVTDSIPTKGISLPFISAGGSGVLFLGLAAGLLASVGRKGDSKRSAE